MSDINRNLQFQLLLLRGTFGGASRVASNAAYNAACDATSYAAFDAASRDAYNAACDVAYDATFNVACNATYNAASIHKKELGGENIDAVMLTSFKEVFKLDKKIREEIETKAMVKISADYKSSKSEKELVESLLVVDISNMLAPIQTYWMYSIWCCIACAMECTIDLDDLLSSFEKKRKEMILPDKYKKLLTLLDIEYLSSLADLGNVLIKPLISIVSEYYGLKDRELFLQELCQMD